MAKGNTKFTTRLSSAIETLHGDEDLALSRCECGSLYSPVFSGKRYEWLKVMDSDGLLVAPRRCEGISLSAPVDLLLGTVIQSEETTSLTKPNPIGKAALPHIQNGIWVKVGGSLRRLDRIQILFVVPKGTAQHHRKRFETTEANVLAAAALMPDTVALVIDRGWNASKIAEELKATVRSFFKGPGRPKGS